MSADQPEPADPAGSTAPTGFDLDDDVLALLGHDGAALPTSLDIGSW
ncbi:hypothetical protein [Pseudonocardia pini]|nr:hypothetical protein [Pseudonocardia pini]